MSQPIEGYFIVTQDDLIFEVKGVIHPSDRVIAYLRYVPANEGPRQFCEDIRYKKIYNLKERELYLRKKHPEYLWFDPNHKRILQSVPNQNISYILDPVDRLRQLQDKGKHLSKLQKASLGFARILVDVGKLDWSSVGITGSQLVGLELESSDIDLVIYGTNACMKLYSKLKINFDTIVGLKRYSNNRLEKHVSFRWGKDNRQFQVLKEIEANKVLQGIFDSHDFFIRLVKFPSEISYNYGDIITESQGICELDCLIKDDSESMYTPCIYSIECKNNPEIRRLVSFRGRFAEHASKGMRVKARGNKEIVTNRNNDRKFSQLVLGEDPNDYLLPL